MICPGATFIRASVIAVVLLAAGNAASAGPINFIELDSGAIDRQSASPISGTFSEHSGFEGTNFYSIKGFASARPGELKASASALIQLTPAVTLGLGPLFQTTDAIAGFLLDDVIISGPGPTTQASLNLALDGALIATTFAQLGMGFGYEAQAGADIRIGATVNGTSFFGTLERSAHADVDTQSNERNGPFETGLLIDFNGESVTTPTMVLPVDTPFRIVISLQAAATASSLNTIVGSRRQAEGSALFDSTLSFPLSGPVFNLAPGYTVNSVAGLIVDNQWEGGSAAQPVPEPSSVLLLGTGLVLLTRRAFNRGKTDLT